MIDTFPLKSGSTLTTKVALSSTVMLLVVTLAVKSALVTLNEVSFDIELYLLSPEYTTVTGYSPTIKPETGNLASPFSMLTL